MPLNTLLPFTMRNAFASFGKWMLIAAMITAFGGHWLVLQSVAWTTMIIDNSKSAHIGEAFKKTFDGRHPCALCRSIEKGRQSEKKPDTLATVEKIDLFLHTGAIVLLNPLPSRPQRACDTFAPGRTPPPLLQPPRNLQVS